MQPRHERIHNITGLIAHWKDFVGVLNFYGHTFRFHQSHQILRREDRQGGMQEPALIAVGFNNAPHIRILREIAPRAARHENLHAGLLIFFQQQRALASFGSGEGGD